MSRYIFETKMEVRDYECDIEGIVNNANYLHYMEHTRHLFLKECGLSFAEMHNKGVDAVVARMNLQYKVPLQCDDEFFSRLWLEKQGVRYVFHQDIFRAKDGVLAELVEFMFSNQFATARSMAGAQLPPAYVYAVETAIQMTLTELNENLREIYIEAYTQKEASDYIFRETAKELYQIFGSYQPELTAQDFFFMELGSAGIMRAYMAHPCDEELTLEKKLQMFLTMSLRSYHVPEDEIQKIIAFIGGMDIRTVSERVMHELFKALAMRFEFTL